MIFITSCAPHPTSRRKEWVMGVKSEIVIAGKDKSQREQTLDEVFKILHDIDAKMSHFKGTSEITRINLKGFEKPQGISTETFEVIQTAVEFYGRTNGAFDITILPLMNLWGFYTEKPKLPTAEQIKKILPRVGSENLVLDSNDRTVGFTVSGMGIDLGGIAKGYACDQVVRHLKKRGIESALINVGGTLYGLGNAPNGKPWRVGIRHPRDPAWTYQVIPLKNEAISTSGDYEQFFVVDKHRYSHMMDPRTGYPADQLVSTSIVARSATLADVLSTSLFILGREKVGWLKKHFPDIRWYVTYLTEDSRLEMESYQSQKAQKI